MKIGSDNWKQLIVEGARDFGIDVDRQQVEQFAVHASELLRWNRKTNLTAITDPKGVALKHFLDSLLAQPFMKPNARVLDIGSGAGFPGVPLKIVMPSLRVTLIDASRKKVSFLNHLIRTLRLKTITARHVRAEELARDLQGEDRFDVVISRALTSIEEMVRLSLPLLKAGGSIVALKGPELQREMVNAAVRQVPAEGTVEIAGTPFLLKVETFALPHIGSRRSMICLQAPAQQALQ